MKIFNFNEELNNKVQKFKVQTAVFLAKSFAYIKIFLLFLILWFLLSGSKDYFMITCGIISITFTFIACTMGKIISPNSFILKPYFFKYIYFLIKNIITSSIQVMKIIYSEESFVDPGIMIVNISNLTDPDKVLFSNLITMTPGTFVISVEKNSFLIHAIDKSNLNFKKNNEIANLLEKMKEKNNIKYLKTKNN